MISTVTRMCCVRLIRKHTSTRIVLMCLVCTEYRESMWVVFCASLDNSVVVFEHKSKKQLGKHRHDYIFVFYARERLHF